MSNDFTLTSACPQRAIGVEPFHVWAMPGDVRWLEFYRAGNGFLLRFPNQADFQVTHDGGEISCAPAPGVSEDTVRHLFLNQVLPLALNARGALAFHASAVVVGGVAIAFLGPSRRGKSTLAASFAAHGHPFLTDDGLIVEKQSGRFHILPSHPSIRLWEDSEAEVIGAAANPVLAVEYTTKSRFLAGNSLSHCDSPMPFRAAYFLGEGDVPDVVIRPLRQANCLVEMVKHSFQLDIEDPKGLSRHFEGVAKLCESVPGFHLDYPRRYDGLQTVRQAIVAHAMGEELA